MAQSFWLINSNRSEVRRFIKNTANKDRFFEYMFVDSGKIVGVLGKEPPVMTKREELKIDNARDEYKKLLSQGWRKTRQFGKIRIRPQLATNIPNLSFHPFFVAKSSLRMYSLIFCLSSEYSLSNFLSGLFR